MHMSMENHSILAMGQAAICLSCRCHPPIFCPVLSFCTFLLLITENLWWIYIWIKSVVNLIKSLNVFGKAAWTWCLIYPTSGNETEWERNDRKLFLCFITWIWKGTHLCILLNLYQFPRRVNQRSLALHRMWIFKKCHWLWGNTS